MFKIKYVNGDTIDTTTNISAVLGQGVHKALEALLSNTTDPQDIAIIKAREAGMEYLNNYSDGFMQFSATIENREKLNERYAFAFNEYVKYFTSHSKKNEILMIEKVLKHRVAIGDKELPVPLKGVVDYCYRDSKGRIRIEDHKTASKFSDLETIDGAKLLQAAFMYFLVSAETGEIPYDMTFREVKITKNKDNSEQVREYTIVYKDMPQIFELFYRMYDDVTNSLLGKAVYVPNLNTLFDKEVSILAYIHRLDDDETRAKVFKANKVDNITDFLKKKIATEQSTKKFLENVNKKFISSITLNYKDMTMQEKIKIKLAEHGLGLDFHSVINGYSVDMYQFEPSIGLKMSKIETYVKDIEQVTEKSGIRVLAPIPNTGLVGFEIPAETRKYPTSDINHKGFDIAIGVDIFGNEKRIDIRQAPHLLVAGATGAGKSVFLASTIKQLQSIPNADLWLFDPKMVELVEFEGTQNVVKYQSDIMDISQSISSLVETMNARYKKMQALKVKNIRETDMRYIFAIIDEYGDLVSSTSKESRIRDNILLLAQKARACGIHIILTTQRPSVRILDGDIKANFPTRISFRTSTAIDSSVILDQAGAEKLLGTGDMLLKTADEVIRLQGYNL